MLTLISEIRERKGLFPAVVKFGSALLLLRLACAETCLSEPARPFSHPDRIRYDSQCLTIDGRDVFIYSGAFHYFRSPEELWPDRFQKIKDAGFNCVETYVPWNWSEREMPSGLDDFSKLDLSGLDEFLTMAEKFGLYVIVRPGPYICAEWDTGGFPQWLLTKQPVEEARDGHWLRGDDPVYLAWCKHWYDAVCPIIARHQITQKAPGQPGVILMQLENEYDYAHFPDDVKLNQIRMLGQTARADGIDVPLITCWTAQVRGQSDPLLRQIFDCCNFYPRWDVDSIRKDIETLRREQPDAPLATTELQGGWFSKVGGKSSEDQDGLTAAQINNLTLFAIQNGETILNYYMLFGGTNPGDWGARDITTTYDYNAPIREWGGVGERYQVVRALGRFLREHGPKLARSELVRCDVNLPQKDVAVAMRRALDGARYVFVRTSQHGESRQGTARLKEEKGGAELVFDYQLEPFGSKILYLPPGATNALQGEWLPAPAPAIQRPADSQLSVNISSIVMHDDPGPAHWRTLKTNEMLADAGVFDSHFILYRDSITTPIATNLLVEFPEGDAVIAEVNGQPVAPLAGTAGKSVFPLPAGGYDVRLLYENHGHANGGTEMERPSGILAAWLIGQRFGAGKPIGGWHMQLVSGTDDRAEVKPDFNDAGWKPVLVNYENANQLTPNQCAVFRAHLDMRSEDLNGASVVLKFKRIDDRGWIFVNGANIGAATDWSRAWSYDITKDLHPGRNVIAVLVQNDGGDGGIGVPELAETTGGAAVALESFARPEGDEQKWYGPEMNDSDWRPMSVGQLASAASNAPLLTWYRMKFSLPAQRDDVWQPWRLNLAATGNGFLYLNGHDIGRYWQAGPQHEFFLPECWLHFGTGQTNLLTLNLRPVDGKASIQSAAVEPYAGFAEQRQTSP